MEPTWWCIYTQAKEPTNRVKRTSRRADERNDGTRVGAVTRSHTQFPWFPCLSSFIPQTRPSERTRKKETRKGPRREEVDKDRRKRGRMKNKNNKNNKNTRARGDEIPSREYLPYSLTTAFILSFLIFSLHLTWLPLVFRAKVSFTFLRFSGSHSLSCIYESLSVTLPSSNWAVLIRSLATDIRTFCSFVSCRLGDQPEAQCVEITLFRSRLKINQTVLLLLLSPPPTSYPVPSQLTTTSGSRSQEL